MARGSGREYGWLLRVDLSTGQISEEQLDPHWLRLYVGGIGLGTRILYDEVLPGVGCFDPENRLVFSTGPLVGTAIPGSSIYTVVTKGPLTEGLAGAQANGFFGGRLRYAGFDAIVFQGASPEWVYLLVADGKAELRPANHLVGLDTYETEDRLRDELGSPKASLACIGPAGEHLVRFASVCNDRGHIAATNGPGAVMGAKKLKAVVVAGERARLGVADPERLKALVPQWRASAATTIMGSSCKAGGTLGGLRHMSLSGSIPVRNMSTSDISTDDRYSYDYIRSHFELKSRPCWACDYNHCKEVKIVEGRYAGVTGDLAEYEGMAGWGPLIGNVEPDAAIMLSIVNDRLGMDLKEASFTVSMVMECYARGLIAPEQTDRLELTWGNVEAVAQLLDAIAHRRGFGDVLAEGVMRAALQIGGDAPKFGVYHKRGNAPHVHDVRHQWGAMLRQAVSDMGSSVSWEPEAPVIEGAGMTRSATPFSAEEIAQAVAKLGPIRQFQECMNVCLFHLPASRSLEAEAIAAATGWDFTPQEGLLVGRRVVALQRAFNLRHGLTAGDDDVISHRMTEPPQAGRAAGKTVAPFFSEMKRIYYQEMGWDEASGTPSLATLRELGLDDVAADLWP